MTSWPRLHCLWAGPFYARAGPAVIETAMGQTQLAGRSSHLASTHDETREQGYDCPRNKRTILGYPTGTHDSAGQSFALSGHMATRRAQTSAPEARMGLLPQAPHVAAHRREVARRWRERKPTLEAASKSDEGAHAMRRAGGTPPGSA
jgi:hypothetical protein